MSGNQPHQDFGTNLPWSHPLPHDDQLPFTTVPPTPTHHDPQHLNENNMNTTNQQTPETLPSRPQPTSNLDNTIFNHLPTVDQYSHLLASTLPSNPLWIPQSSIPSTIIPDPAWPSFDFTFTPTLSQFTSQPLFNTFASFQPIDSMSPLIDSVPVYTSASMQNTILPIYSFSPAHNTSVPIYTSLPTQHTTVPIYTSSPTQPLLSTSNTSVPTHHSAIPIYTSPPQPLLSPSNTYQYFTSLPSHHTTVPIYTSPPQPLLSPSNTYQDFTSLPTHHTTVPIYTSPPHLYSLHPTRTKISRLCPHITLPFHIHITSSTFTLSIQHVSRFHNTTQRKPSLHTKRFHHPRY
ncbi:hypothetical protein BC829DRAFT_50185 [Chytridium lagenaria]|nr:hypothetical protein BC829DRAFT_50185 [Chytridium lagenaria]